jgi:antitoxin CptB
MKREALERLRWRSRRGLLELDIVFTRFWAREGEGLSEAEGRALEQLLLLPDNDLLELVMGTAHAPAGDLGDLVKKLKAA